MRGRSFLARWNLPFWEFWALSASVRKPSIDHSPSARAEQAARDLSQRDDAE